jgi:hypothetical protein
VEVAVQPERCKRPVPPGGIPSKNTVVACARALPHTLDLQERLGAVVAIPLFAAFGGMFIYYAWESLLERGLVTFVFFGVFACLFWLGALVNLWALGVTGPLRALGHL